MTVVAVRRPGVITFITIVVVTQAAMAAAVALVTLALAGDDRVQAETGLSVAGLLSSGILEALVAVVLFVAAAGLLSGASGARMFIALVEAFRMVTAVILMITHHAGGYAFNALIAVIIGMFVLWALYVYPPADEYFRRYLGEPENLRGRRRTVESVAPDRERTTAEQERLAATLEQDRATEPASDPEPEPELEAEPEPGPQLEVEPDELASERASGESGENRESQESRESGAGERSRGLSGPPE